MTDPGAGILSAAAALFRLAARTFATEIDPDFYHAIIAIADASPAAQPGSSLLDPHVRALSEEAALEELATEYCRLFIGPRPACPPYASAQLGNAYPGGKAPPAMTTFLRENGLMVSGFDALPILAEDHIAVGLTVLGELLAAIDGESVVIPDSGQAARIARELREHHLLAWAPQFLRAVRETSRLAPYGPVADFTRGLLLREELFSTQLVSTPMSPHD